MKILRTFSISRGIGDFIHGFGSAQSCWMCSAYISSNREEHRRMNSTSSHGHGISQAIEQNTPRIRSAVSLNHRKSREKHNRILLEGWRLIHDALQAKAEPITIFYSDARLMSKLPVDTPPRLFAHVSDETMKVLSTAVTPPGIVGVFKKPCQGGDPKDCSIMTPSSRLPLTVICDGIRDPSNLGTVVRTCAAAGCKSLITSKGSVDVWDPKVLRGGAGGHFRIPMFYSLTWDEIVQQLDNDARIFLADSDNKGRSNNITRYFDVDWTLGPSVLIVGGETTGISSEALMFAKGGMEQAVHVPMMEGMDSLSAAVAACLIVYEAYRQVNK